MKVTISLVVTLALMGHVAHADDEKPKAVSMSVLENLMTAGERDIQLPPAVREALKKATTKRLLIMAKLCLSAKGEPTAVDVVKDSGYPEADQNVIKKMKEWRFKPYTVDGKAVPVCTALVYSYSIDGTDNPLDGFKSMLGKWKCKGDATVEVTRTGSLLSLMYVEKERQAASWVSSERPFVKYVMAGTDSLGHVWTGSAEAATAANGELSWTGGGYLVETHSWTEAALHIHGHLGSDGPKWDLDCRR
jgi:hypothetical protein